MAKRRRKRKGYHHLRNATHDGIHRGTFIKARRFKNGNYATIVVEGINQDGLSVAAVALTRDTLGNFIVRLTNLYEQMGH